MDASLSVPAESKALATGLALAVLLVAEHVIPAHAEGRGGWRHDLRNLALGGANALLVAALIAWVLPWPPTGSGLVGLLGGGAAAALAVGVLGMDLWMYAWHRANHVVPWLWRFHRVHHADPNMDASTGVRFHPGEALLSAFGRVPVVYVLGISLGHVVVYEMVLLPVILFHHSNVRFPEWIDRPLRFVLVTPGVHRIHHSPERAETDSNYGSVFTIWDRLARSLRRQATTPAPRYGLHGFDRPELRRLRGLLALPFRGGTREP
jgi:sterol desaturase/sphingolipid hydroxylase (fatty acid hydroxylase superfamily)